MFKSILITTLLSYSFCLAQYDSITLPIGGVNKFDLNKNHYTIHYTKEKEMFFNHKRIRFWDQIASSILEEERQPKLNAVSNIIIYADKELSYAYIERIRHEIGKVWNGFLHYKSDGYKTENCLSFYINGSAMSATKYKDTDWVYGPKIIYTSKEYTGESTIPTLEGWVWPINTVWQHNFAGDFFDNNIAYAKNILEELSYNSLEIVSKSAFIYNSKLQKFENLELINKITFNNDLLFVKTRRGLNYNTYFEAMTIIQDNRIQDREHGVLKKPFIIEVPYIYEKKISDNSIKLFN
ncbi:hypothetical protein [Pontimicrobium sp. SW4]|uniref:GLPGLI family protein n=1 Tax=Pontimicrobium sp. SW4 TaxID=3153519 RepID=A0AAU7BNX0_9FLAO